MRYDLAKFLIQSLLRPISDAGIALARLDERIARSPVGAGWIERTHFADACASLLMRRSLTSYRASTSSMIGARRLSAWASANHFCAVSIESMLVPCHCDRLQTCPKTVPTLFTEWKLDVFPVFLRAFDEDG